MHHTPLFASVLDPLNFGRGRPIKGRGTFVANQRAWHGAVDAYLFGHGDWYRWALAKRSHWHATKPHAAPASTAHRHVGSRSSRVARQQARKAAASSSDDGDGEPPAPEQLPLVACEGRS